MTSTLPRSHDREDASVLELAADYVLGELDLQHLQAFEDHLIECAACRDEVRRLSEIPCSTMEFALLSPPPADLRKRVCTIGQLPGGVAALVRAGAGAWTETGFPGVSIRPLFSDPETGDLVSLVRMSAGSEYPSHSHRDIEHCYVLEGDLVFSDHTLFAGDYEAALPGGTHSVVRSDTGCLLLLMNNALDELHV